MAVQWFCLFWRCLLCSRYPRTSHCTQYGNALTLGCWYCVYFFSYWIYTEPLYRSPTVQDVLHSKYHLIIIFLIPLTLTSSQRKVLCLRHTSKHSLKCITRPRLSHLLRLFISSWHLMISIECWQTWFLHSCSTQTWTQTKSYNSSILPRVCVDWHNPRPSSWWVLHSESWIWAFMPWRPENDGIQVWRDCQYSCGCSEVAGLVFWANCFICIHIVVAIHRTLVEHQFSSIEYQELLSYS